MNCDTICVRMIIDLCCQAQQTDSLSRSFYNHVMKYLVRTLYMVYTKNIFFIILQ